MNDEPQVTVTLVSPSGVCTRIYSDGAATMRVCLGHIRHEEDGLLVEMSSGHEPIPWASAEVRNDAMRLVKERKDLDDEARGPLLEWIQATPYYAED